MESNPNFATGTWAPGDRVRYHDMLPNQQPHYLDVVPGLYWYSGLGVGHLFRADGTMLLNCSPVEAAAECHRLGLRYWFVDSFINIGRAVRVGD